MEWALCASRGEKLRQGSNEAERLVNVLISSYECSDIILSFCGVAPTYVCEDVLLSLLVYISLALGHTVESFDRACATRSAARTLQRVRVHAT